MCKHTSTPLQQRGILRLSQHPVKKEGQGNRNTSKTRLHRDTCLWPPQTPGKASFWG